ncbi:glycosyltransferase [Candidatus Sumerlaeota bacterium]|nr:glycosyltransferase [Candidatus Sumerlaeota bacterium]
MADLPLVSIVTPSFNSGRYLEETLLSVQRQDYPHIEHIVIDGGSTDGSVDIIRKHEKHLAYWVSEPDRGQSNALNKGSARARGSILAHLCADDLLAPSAVRIAVYFLSLDPTVGLVYGDRLYIDAKGNVVGIHRCPSHDPHMFRKDLTLPDEATFFRRALFEEVGGIDEDLEFSMGHDLWCKLAKITQMRHIPAFLGYFRRHDSSKSVLFDQPCGDLGARYREEHKQAYRRHFGRGVPSPVLKKWYRFCRQMRLLLELKSKAHRHEVQMIRQIISAPLCD